MATRQMTDDDQRVFAESVMFWACNYYEDHGVRPDEEDLRDVLHELVPDPNEESPGS